MFVGGADADDLLRQLGHLRIAAIHTCHEGVRLARLDHHHAEGVAVHHLLASLAEGNALACLLLRQDAGVAMPALGLPVVAQVDNLDAL